MLPEIPSSQLSAALEDAVDLLLSVGGVAGPPVDAFLVAAANGVVVALDNSQTGRARYVRLAGPPGRARRGGAQPSILVRPDPRPERRQWAVAHELGEHTAHVVFSRLAIDPAEAPAAARETVANYLASRLLLPSRWFAAVGRGSDWELPALKEVFGTASHELIARRMLDFEPPACMSIFDHGRLHFRSANGPGRAPPLLAIERACQLAAHEAGTMTARTGEQLRVRAWPIHEPDWKREIVRSERAAGLDWDE